MSLSNRFMVCVTGVGLLCGSTSVLAQTPRPPVAKGTVPGTAKSAQTRPPANNTVPRQATLPGNTTGRASLPNAGNRPPAQAFRVQRPSLEVQTMLAEWEDRTSKIKRMEGSFTKFSYDDVFLVEKRAVGKFCYEAPDRGAFEQEGSVPNGVKESRKLDPKTGKPYTIEADQDLRWVCDGEEIMIIKETEKEYESVGIPVEQRGLNIINTPLPFVFGMKADQAIQRYEIALNANSKLPNTIWLIVKPLWHNDQMEWKQADVLLDKKTFLPQAIRLLDPAGAKLTTYTFEAASLKVNQRSWSTWLTGDPLKPNLRGYKKVIAPEGNPEAEPLQQSRGEGIQVAPKPNGKRSASLPAIAPQRTARLPAEASKSRIQ